MREKLLSGMFWLLLLNLLLKPVWILGIDLGVQNAVGDAEYGFYIVVFNLSYIFNILLDLGITNFNTRNIARHPQLITKHLSHILSLKLLLFALYLVVTFTVGLLRGFDAREYSLLAWLSFNQFLSSLILYLRSNFEGLLLFRLDSVLSVLDRLLMVVICGFLLLASHRGSLLFRIEYFVYTQTLAYLLTLVVALTALARRVGLRRLRFSRPFSMAVLRRSLPFALLVLLMASYNRIDPILLDWLLPSGAEQAGIYAKSFRLLDALSMVAYLVSVPLLPTYARLLAQDDYAQVRSLTRLVYGLLLLFAVACGVGCSCFSQPIIALLYPASSSVGESAAVFRVLILGLIPISTTYVFGTLLTAQGALRQLNLMAAATLLINIAVNLLLIPRLGAVGSAWASLVAQSFMALAQMLAAIRILYRKTDNSKIQIP